MAAIFFLIRSIPSLLSFGPSLSSLYSTEYSGNSFILFASVFSFLIFVAFMVACIKYSEYFACKIISNDQPLFTLSNLSSLEIQSIAFSWIALVILLSGLSGIAGNCAHFLSVKAAIGAEEFKIQEVQGLTSRIVSNLSEIIMGVILFLYPKAISRLWHLFQNKNTPTSR